MMVISFFEEVSFEVLFLKKIERFLICDYPLQKKCENLARKREEFFHHFKVLGS